MAGPLEMKSFEPPRTLAIPGGWKRDGKLETGSIPIMEKNVNPWKSDKNHKKGRKFTSVYRPRKTVHKLLISRPLNLGTVWVRSTAKKFKNDGKEIVEI